MARLNKDCLELGVTITRCSECDRVEPFYDNWIPCSKMMPKNQTAVLICLEWNAYDIAWLDGDLWVSELTVYDFETVMAWMPLPEAYKEKDNE